MAAIASHRSASTQTEILTGTTPSLAFQLRAKSRTQGTRQFNNPITGANSKAGVLIHPTRSALFGTNSVGGTTDGGTIWKLNPARDLVPVYYFFAPSPTAWMARLQRRGLSKMNRATCTARPNSAVFRELAWFTKLHLKCPGSVRGDSVENRVAWK